MLLLAGKTGNGAKSDKFAKGRIALQHGKGADESDVVKFRNVETKPLA